MKLYRAPARKSMETSTLGSRKSSSDQGSTFGQSIIGGQRFDCPSNHRNSDANDSGHGGSTYGVGLNGRSASGQSSSTCARSSCGTLTVPRSSCTSNISLTGFGSGPQRKKSSEANDRLLTSGGGNERKDGAGSTHSAHSSTSIIIGSKDRRGSRANTGQRRDNFAYTSVRREEMY